MLHIFVQPFSQRSGNDVIGVRTAQALTNLGLPATSRDLWPDWITSAMMSGKIPFGRRIFQKGIAPYFARCCFSNVRKGDVFWVLGSATPMIDEPSLERETIKKGGCYIFHVMDDWFSEAPMRQATIARCSLAQLVVVPTPELYSRVRQILPKAKVIRLEEPIDTDRVHPLPAAATGQPPLVVWCGNPGQFGRLSMAVNILNKLRKRLDFRFRVISGRKPDIPLNFDWEWLAYNYLNESHLLAGAVAGLAPLDDTPYTRCKGAYKVKTYMAAGIPTIASPVGYQRELVQEGVTGFLPGSDEAWEEALERLITNPELVSVMGTASREVAISRFSYTATIPSWVQAIKNVPNGSP